MYQDQHGEFFGRVNEDGNVDVLHADGSAATRMDCSVYPIGSDVSARYEHPAGITISQDDAKRIGLDIE
jgi:hypothetical protein